MWESSNIEEKKFNAETHRLIGEAQLHEFGVFLEQLNEDINKKQKKFKNVYDVKSQIILLDEQNSSSNSIYSLIHSDNKNLSRILTSLAAICNEMNILVKEAEELYPQFLFYNGENKVLDYLCISKIIDPLQKVHLFVKRVQEVTIVTLKQVCAILGRKNTTNSNTCAFSEVLYNFGDLLVCLLKLDSILPSQIFKDQWFLYRKTVKNMSHNNKSIFSRNQLTAFDKTLVLFENELLMGNILKDTFEKCLENKEFYFQLKNCSLHHEFSILMNIIMNELDKDEEHIDTQMWCKLNIFVSFHCSIFGNTDKKLIKRILEYNRKISACVLFANILWYPEQFLLKHAPNLSKLIDEKFIESHRMNLISARSSTFTKDTNIICFQACYLLLELEKALRIDITNVKVKQLQNITTIFTNGIKLIRKINFLIKWILNIHIDKNLPLTKSVVFSTCKLVEILKSIYLIFCNNMIKLAYIILLLMQHLSHKALSVLQNIKKQFTQEKSYKEHELDVLSAFNLCERALKHCCTNHSLLVANLSLSASGLSSNSLIELRSILDNLGLVLNFSTTLRELSNCSFIQWHQNYILPIYFSKILALKTDISRHYLVIKAVNDCNITNKENKIIENNFYKPLEQLIEVNLRLQTHLHLQLPPVDSFQNYFPLNFNKFLPLPLHKSYKNIKVEMEHHLSEVFYNLTSVVLHDWKTYGEMRRLAHFEFGLDTIDDNLPMQTLEQGLDVLEIMRNINVFVNKYLYNLNTQVFIERSSNNKHLNSINISHVANSIRTHGIGIMNTTVNFTYQFLRNQFYIFSQFIFDEHIKSRLIKDLRFFFEHKDGLNQMYPYERAEKFNTGIKRLGLNQNSESFLDLFRKVITHIGNAMGYVRLIRSGGRRCLADGTCFIPDLKKINTLRETVNEEQMSELSKKAATGLLDNLQMFVDNIEESTEYFKLLVKVFEPVLRNKNNLHLKNFYVIVPPLTLNFIEHSLNCKEKLNKKNNEYAFTDDGFALGLAYIIEILDQEVQLNSLHWFQSVKRKLKNDKQKIVEQMSRADNHDTKLTQTLSLSEKKILLYKREFQLLYYNYNSARLFFQN